MAKVIDDFKFRKDSEDLSELTEEERKERKRQYNKEYMREYRERNPDYVQKQREQSRVFMKSYRELNLYGLSPGQYEEMLEEQEHRCLICNSLSDVLCVDHNHKTGEVRGLLCKPCNLLIGQSGENIERLMRAADYLAERR